MLGSSLQTLTTNGNTGYLAYAVGWKKQHLTKEGTNYDTRTETSFITTSHSGLSNCCFDNSASTNTQNVSTDETTTGGHSPTTLKSMIAADSVTIDYTKVASVDMPLLNAPFDFSKCYDPDPAITAISAGSFGSSICYDATQAASLVFSAPTITTPSGCTDAFWEYNVKVAPESPTATFPHTHAI